MMKRKQFYFYCRKCLKRQPVEQESRQRIGCCRTCYEQSQEIDAEFVPMAATQTATRENTGESNAPNEGSRG